MNLNELKDKAYKTACEKGFHDVELSDAHLLALVITELSEAIEADWKGKRFSEEDRKEYDNCQKEKFYMYAFDNYIKGTVEEELADSFIRMLDLYGLRGIELNENAFNDKEISEYSTLFKSKSFTEAVYFIIIELTSAHKFDEVPEHLQLLFLGFAKHLGIDLIWFVEQKMRYNESREKMHGKKY